MRRFRELLLRLTGIFRKERRGQDFAAEIDSHLQFHIDDNLRAGMAPAEARRQAILTLGGIETTTQAYREQSTVPILETFSQDLRFATRQLRKNLGFTATAVLMLALGMCASIAIFAFVDAALIKPLPYANPRRLVSVTETTKGFPRANLSYPDYLDWKKMNKVFDSLDVYNGQSYLLPGSAGAEVVRAERVSDGFFRTLGIVPVLGRDFYAGEDRPNAPKTAILSYATWQNRYAGSKNVIGQTVVLSGIPTVIVGVLPQTFQFAPRNTAEFWAPLQATSSCDIRRGCHGLYGIGRLKDGVSVPTALANMAAIAQQLERQYPASNRGQGAIVEPLSEVIVGGVRAIFLTLLGGAGLLLLIACVKVASLLLVRSEGRRREIAVRGALGASRGRLTRQFITEGLVLVAIGSTISIVLAGGAMKLLMRLLSKNALAQMPYLDGLSLNTHVLAFAAVVALLAAIVFSLTPVLRLSATEIHAGLAEGSRGSAGVLWRRLGANLVVAELAIAMVLLVGAGLLGKSFYRLLHVDLGFQPDHLATLQIAIPPLNYPKDEQRIALAREIIRKTSALPGVRSAAVTSIVPVNGNGNTNWIRIAGRPYNGEHNEIDSRDISSGYFTTLQAKLLRGRYFTDDEDASRPLVAIVNQALVKQYFPGEDPIGKTYGDPELSPKSLRMIVGVVDDIREASLDNQTWPTEYLPFNQSPDSFYYLIARSTQAEQTLLPSMNAAVHEADPGIGTIGAATMTETINASQTAYLHRSSAWLVGGFAVLALLLGVVGLYGVIAYSVSQRTREIGVRMALGAQRAAVYRLILTEAGWLTGWGIATGIVCSIGTATLMRNLLFGTAAWDAATLSAVAVMLAASALLASFIPAHRAATVNPVDALRAE